MSNGVITQKLTEVMSESSSVVANNERKVAKPVAVAPAVDRKFVQKVKAEVEQQERQLARAIVTALATCSLIVAWMVMARTGAQEQPFVRAQPAPVVQVVAQPVSQPEIIPTVYVATQSVPIPTLVAEPARQRRRPARP
jgi:2-keto-3-deoxy-galactonokinase